MFTLFLSPFEFSNVLYGCDDLDIGKATRAVVIWSREEKTVRVVTATEFQRTLLCKDSCCRA